MIPNKNVKHLFAEKNNTGFLTKHKNYMIIIVKQHSTYISLEIAFHCAAEFS